MAPKKGNKHAVGHGRPPNPGFSDIDLKKLGEEILAWCKKMDKQKKEIVHLSEFYSEIKQIHYSQWKSLTERECFLPYYEKAREWLGKRILKSDRLPTAYGGRFLGMYCKDLHQHEREQVEHKIDYEIKKKQEMQNQDGIAPKQDLADLKDELYAQKYENQQLRKQIDEFKSKASPELQRSDAQVQPLDRLG